ncbi:bifunctional adenosylcobinamide kinase/adenosylcobinamide-phosphate guanylyltransferase [bacterium]|nr:bifunctional adenosylcobinamide kinase/adenosylcobinamide-phosphate guanylyltransferase [bacterium]MBU1599146.1 bifunctional adenosylcobinamide kinase/adenosylcobinamide-phosphate guanylyltransferase [bacterium]
MLIFITGGARSGKSQYAVRLASKESGDVLFLATCIPKDEEMRQRVEEHRKNRPKSWKTLEEERDILPILKGCQSDVVVIDCLTLLLSNLLLAGDNVEEIIKGLADFLKEAKFTTIIVSNEVGLGIVPENEMARRFRDISGWANQLMARYADEVYFMVSGIPIKIKG